MTKFIYVIYEEYDRTDDSWGTVTKALNDVPRGKEEAANLVDAHPNAVVIYGNLCQVIHKRTEIILPEEEEKCPKIS